MPIRRFLAFFAFVMVCGMHAEQRKIVIATLEYPPFIYSEDDQVKGPLVDKVRGIFTQLGIEATIKAYPIARGGLMVRNGEVDAYFSLKKTPEREEDLLFTKQPLIQQPFVFFARNDSGIHWNGDFEEIKNYRIGIVTSTSYGSAFDECVRTGLFPNIDVAQSFEQNIKKLVAGRIDLIINSYDVGLYILKQIHADTAIVALSPPVDVIDSYLAFTRKRDFSSLADDFDRVLANENR